MSRCYLAGFERRSTARTCTLQRVEQNSQLFARAGRAKRQIHGSFLLGARKWPAKTGRGRKNTGGGTGVELEAIALIDCRSLLACSANGPWSGGNCDIKGGLQCRIMNRKLPPPSYTGGARLAQMQVSARQCRRCPQTRSHQAIISGFAG